MQRIVPKRRVDFPHFLDIPTRWGDNDVYGHVNNVIYYSYFDTVVNRFLIENGALDLAQGTVVGLVVKTQCDYFSSVAFPDTLDAGLRVARIGNSSVHYEVAIFKKNHDAASAQGEFIHVYVDRVSNKPVALPDNFRSALKPILVNADHS